MPKTDDTENTKLMAFRLPPDIVYNIERLRGEAQYDNLSMVVRGLLYEGLRQALRDLEPNTVKSWFKPVPPKVESWDYRKRPGYQLDWDMDASLKKPHQRHNGNPYGKPPV